VNDTSLTEIPGLLIGERDYASYSGMRNLVFHELTEVQAMIEVLDSVNCPSWYVASIGSAHYVVFWK